MNNQEFQQAYDKVSAEPLNIVLPLPLVQCLDLELLDNTLQDVWYVSDRVENWSDWLEMDYDVEDCVQLAIKYIDLKTK